MNNKSQSVWTDNLLLPSFPRLEKSTSTEVLIIGGGMSGLLCAYALQQQGIPYLLCEAATIGSGTTQKTTAVISAQHDMLYTDMVNSFGKDKAKMYLEANLIAVAKFRELSASIDCDFEDKPSYIYSQDDRSLMEKEVQTLNALGINAQLVSKIPLPVAIAGAVRFPAQGQFHPWKFLKGICEDLHIFEHTQIHKVTNNKAYTGEYEITANKIIVASHFPIINTHGMYFAKLYQKRSYIIALENAQDIAGTYVDNKEHGMYFRNYKNLLLIGGGDHRTGKTGGNFAELRQFAQKHYPQASEKYAWATQDCMSLDGIPYIGQYCKFLPDVFVASGFNEWGMTSSMVAADILTDMLIGKQNDYAEVFCPARSMLKPQLFANIGTTTLDFLTPTTKRCPHLGCALKYNSLEHTWDCPCHGSRFTENGQLIDNPATGDLYVK